MGPGTTHHIRPARAADVPRIEEIVRLGYERYIPRMGKKPGPMLDDYRQRVADGTAWVLETDGANIAGVVVLLPEDDHLLLDNVALDPAFHGRGFGRLLVEFADQEARRLGLGEVRLYTHITMTENIAMYPRFGYVETHRGEQAGFERVFMRKKL